MEPIDTETFERQGFLVISNFCSPLEIDQLQLVRITVDIIYRYTYMKLYDDAQECGFLLELGQRRSCIYEPVGAALLEQSPQEARWAMDEYKQLRTRYPLGRQTLEILFSEKMRRVVEAFLGSDARLFNEQFIVKPHNSGMEGCFGWHRDSDSLNDTNIPYISIWIALDDVTLDNGCLVVEDTAQGGAHRALEIPKGSAVVMSHLLMHTSGENKTRFQRRAWMPQFSKGPILSSVHNNLPVSLAIPMCMPSSSSS
jgi:hypothetical protein